MGIAGQRVQRDDREQHVVSDPGTVSGGQEGGRRRLEEVHDRHRIVDSRADGVDDGVDPGQGLVEAGTRVHVHSGRA